MNQDREKNNNVFSKTLFRMKKWPIERKRIFSILLALFFTFLIIIFNSGINLIWKDETKNTAVNNNPINTIQESLSQIINQASTTFNQSVSSSTQTEEIIDQTNSTSSSFSTTSNVVE